MSASALIELRPARSRLAAGLAILLHGCACLAALLLPLLALQLAALAVVALSARQFWRAHVSRRAAVRSLQLDSAGCRLLWPDGRQARAAVRRVWRGGWFLQLQLDDGVPAQLLFRDSLPAETWRQLQVWSGLHSAGSLRR